MAERTRRAASKAWDVRAPKLSGSLRPVADASLAELGRDGDIVGLRLTGTLETSDLEGEAPDLARCELVRARLMSVEVDRWRVRDVELDACDLVGVVGGELTLEAVAFRGGRIAGCAWVKSVLRDVTFAGTTAPDLALRFGRLRHVLFDACALPRLDLTETELDHVTFRGCDLSGARFAGARMTAARFLRCDLNGVEGVDGLAGAHVDASALPALAPSLALAAGLRIAPAAEIEALAG